MGPPHPAPPSLDYAADVAKAQAAADAERDTAHTRALLALWCDQQGDYVQALADRYLSPRPQPSRP